MYGHPDAVRTQRPDAIHFFANFDVFKSVKIGLINTKPGSFVNLVVLFLSMGINSCLSHNLKTRT